MNVIQKLNYWYIRRVRGNDRPVAIGLCLRDYQAYGLDSYMGIPVHLIEGDGPPVAHYKLTSEIPGLINQNGPGKLVDQNGKELDPAGQEFDYAAIMARKRRTRNGLSYAWKRSRA